MVSLDYLSQNDLSLITHAIAVLEQSHGAIPAEALPVLAHPDLRLVIDAQLNAVGRIVIEHRHRDQTVESYSTGYADDIADLLAQEGLGVLDPIDRSVVALVLIWCVAMPTVQGRPVPRWSAAPPVTLSQVHHNRRLANKGVVGDAINRLHDARVLVNGRSAGIRPGPAFDRLTPHQQHRIEEDLFMLAAPADPIAVALRRRREASA